MDVPGCHTYALTLCAYGNLPLFAESNVATCLALQLRACADLHRFAVVAYCFMPTRVHLLVEALAEEADLPIFMRVWKRRTGTWARQEIGLRLWQPGYTQRALQDRAATEVRALQILAAPVAAGLVRSPLEYPWLGSFVTTVEDLLARGSAVRARATGRTTRGARTP